MVGLRVCPCFRFSEREEFMEPVANRPWDAWHVIDDGKSFIMNYVIDSFYKFNSYPTREPIEDESTSTQKLTRRQGVDQSNKVTTK
jgi:hypothetical protein